MSVHELKVWPEPFAEIVAGRKRAEIRAVKDRMFAVGDTLHLRCWDPKTATYTGAGADALITSVADKAGPLDLFGMERPGAEDQGGLVPLFVLSFQLVWSWKGGEPPAPDK